MDTRCCQFYRKRYPVETRTDLNNGRDGITGSRKVGIPLSRSIHEQLYRLKAQSVFEGDSRARHREPGYLDHALRRQADWSPTRCEDAHLGAFTQQLARQRSASFCDVFTIVENDQG